VAIDDAWPSTTRGHRRRVAVDDAWPTTTRGQRRHVANDDTWPTTTRGQRRHVANDGAAAPRRPVAIHDAWPSTASLSLRRGLSSRADAIYNLSALSRRLFRRFPRNEKWSTHSPTAAPLGATDEGH
jgi:hypothetical protein